MGDFHGGPVMIDLSKGHHVIPTSSDLEPQDDHAHLNQDLPSHLDSFQAGDSFLPSKNGTPYRLRSMTSMSAGPEVSFHGLDSQQGNAGGTSGHKLRLSFVSDPSTPRSHRRLYTHPANSKNISIDNQPLMLLPKARLKEDKRDLLRAGRSFGVVPQTGLEHLELAAISAASGWIGVKDEDRSGSGPQVRRPATAFHRLRKRERKEADDEETVDLPDTRPSTAHPLTTRRGKMAALYEKFRSESRRSDRSGSADSGIGSAPPDRCTCDVTGADVTDDVIKRSNKTSVFSTELPQAFSETASSREDTKNGKLSDRDSVMSSDSHAQDFAHAYEDDSALPEHLDSFDTVAEAVVQQLRKRKKKESVDNSTDDVFDDRWHRGHDDSETCPYCREFERATKRRVDRYFGGAEPFLKWIFSKWGKVRKLNPMTTERNF